MRSDIFFQLFVVSVAVFFVGISGVFGQQSDCTKTLSDDDSGSTVRLRKGDKLCLKLKARLATGFGWKVTKTDSEKLKLVSESTEKNDEDEATIEFQIFTFEAISKGGFTLELSYARPWEKEKPPAKKYALELKIK